MNLAVSLAALAMLTSCDKDLVTYRKGDVKVTVETGEGWLHDFPLFLGIDKKNPPQLAIWVESPTGEYLSTIYVTRKIATEGWAANKGNRRKESLPVCCYSRGVRYADGLYLPTKDQPLVDGISGATPKTNFDVRMRGVGNLRQFVVKVEVNHSTDWNDDYPKNAAEGTSGWSGGKGGSGQPALVYAATVDLDSPKTSYTATLIGHSSPDGTDGEIRPDTSTITSALNIVKNITINIQ